ncbi:MAG: YdeI/OmpD-associated family protein [Candidatus Paceibacterota bacterium]
MPAVKSLNRKNNMVIASGTVHKIPKDLQKALTYDKAALSVWEDITSLARNEWICWIISVKKDETRKEHVKRTIIELKEGIRRPCCWIGCIHRTDKSVSPSVQGILDKRSKKFRK